MDSQAVIASLDVANDRLQATLASLRKTIVSRELSDSHRDLLRSSHESGDLSPSNAAQADLNSKTLHDFIDESAHLSLLDSLRDTIDSYNDTQADLQREKSSFDSSLLSLDANLRSIDGLAKLDPPSTCLLYTSPSPRDRTRSRMPSSA